MAGPDRPRGHDPSGPEPAPPELDVRPAPDQVSAAATHTTDDIGLAVLQGNAPGMRTGRRFFRLLPSSPRCKLCASPFAAPLGPVMRLVGKAPWPANPKYCSMCFRGLVRHRSGAEIDASLLFADVRESTALAERLRPMEFRDTMDRFFDVASEVLVDHDAIVDKFVGDEVMAIFIPALTGEHHAEHAVEAGRALLAATGNDTATPWVPIGIGVSSGITFVGAVGGGDKVELTAMGDTVNVAARLASSAAAGELLVTTAAAVAAHLRLDAVEHRRLRLKGKSESTDVVVLGAG